MKKIQIYAVAILMFSLVFTSCEKSIFPISGSGDIVEKTLSLDEFSKINCASSFNIVVSQGDVQEIKAVGQENIIDRLKTDVSNDTWKAEFMPGNYKNYELTIYITVVNLSAVSISGSGNVDINSFEPLSDLELSINGSGNISILDTIFAETVDISIPGSGKIELTSVTNSITTSISGSGKIFVSGETTNQDISISGSGKYNAFDNISENTDVSISGSGSMEITVNGTLDVGISGSGSVYYKGFPNIIQHISGSGSVVNSN